MAKTITQTFHTEAAFADASAMAERIAFLSKALAAQSLATSEELDGTLADGLV